MKNIFLILLSLGLFVSCKTNDKVTDTKKDKVISSHSSDSLTVVGDDLEYDLVIRDAKFISWLQSNAKPKGAYTQNDLKNKNIRYITEWNLRASQPDHYNANLYPQAINYQKNIDYGYDLNYRLYNYFIYFQNTYNQNLLDGRIPTN
ncbi:DUF6146 family protein [Bizionia paragorgiae]|uniref:DUF6146 family protein n=1 Tax=Bizionia paragorgiae TaxID=283786 RepID=UPI00299ED172|nr:DUF6146 family protein [Bizionia paragorgiae]MDX1270923.1 DUF6146 family protein [Bizionia paragorgiae]